MNEYLESDCIWFCPDLHRDNWTEYFELKSRGRYCEADHNLYRYANQFEVVLSVLEDRVYSAIYTFLKEGDARRFYTGEGLRQGERCWLSERTFCSHCGRFICFDMHELRIDGNEICVEAGEQLGVEECYPHDNPQRVFRTSDHRISRPNVGRRRHKLRR
jgi:hypothetical protein